MRKITPLVLVTLLAVFVSACDSGGAEPPPPPPPPEEEEPTPLRGWADEHNLHIGTAVGMQPFNSDEEYTEVLAEEFNMLTAENAMKWNPLRPNRDAFNFNNADALVDFAEDNEMAVRGHTLVWHSQLPGWLTNGTWSREELIDILDEHITTVVERYAGQVQAWDVVNEAIDDNGNLRQNIWLDTIGEEYIALAFEMAHAADPDAQLYYNDYNIAGSNAKSDAVYALVSDLIDDGVPIDGVGFQAHLSTEYGAPSASDLAANMQRFGDLGLQVAITELDVRIPLPASSQELSEQADIYRRMLNACLDATNCSTFTMWGFTDRYSWVPDTFEGEGAALIFDEEYTPKPAYDALQEALAGTN